MSTLTILTDQSMGITGSINVKSVNTFLRLFRLIRLLRIFKLLKVAPERFSLSAKSVVTSNTENVSKEKERPTKVGIIFSETATCRVIIIVYYNI